MAFTFRAGFAFAAIAFAMVIVNALVLVTLVSVVFGPSAVLNHDSGPSNFAIPFVMLLLPALSLGVLFAVPGYLMPGACTWVGGK